MFYYYLLKYGQHVVPFISLRLGYAVCWLVGWACITYRFLWAPSFCGDRGTGCGCGESRALPFPCSALAQRLTGGEIPASHELRETGRGVNCRSAASHYRKLSRFPRNGWRAVLLA